MLYILYYIYMLNKDIYEIKYLKYKTKYLQLKDLKGAGNNQATAPMSKII